MILLNAPSRWRKGQGPGGVGGHGERASRTQEVRLEFCLQTALKLRFLGATKAHGLAHTQPHSPGIQEQVSGRPPLVKETAWKVAGHPPAGLGEGDWKGMMTEVAQSGWKRLPKNRKGRQGPRPGDKEGAPLYISWAPRGKCRLEREET